VVEDQIITVAELSEWHRKWLGNIYEWAGQERSVNMSKGDFHFATVAQIPRLLAELDKKYLSVYTPCQGFNESRLVEAIAIVHVELILVHPFREGNGRLSRLLANVMAL
jgi:cell filamentation protein